MMVDVIGVRPLGPDLQLPVMSGQSIESLLFLPGRCRAPGRSEGKRAIVVIINRF